MRAVFRGGEIVGRVESFADEPRLVREDDRAVWAPDLQPLDARAENRCQSCSDPDRHHPRHRFLQVDAVEDRDEERVRNEDRMELGIVLVVGLHLTSNHRVRSDPDRQEDDERGSCETEGETGAPMLSVGSHDPP